MKIWQQVQEEYERATKEHNPFHSAHEGLAVLQEEFEELKAEVYRKRGKRDFATMKKEAIQVAAMAIRFVVDVAEMHRE